MSDSRNDALRCSIELMETETLYFTGRNRAMARRKYVRLLKSCRGESSLEEPIYLKRR